jgi:flagellar basal body-associated protein FliL
MNKKILNVIIIVVVAAVVIPIGIYTISPLFTSNTVNEPLPTTAAIVNKNSASQEYQKFISTNEQDRTNAAKQMSQRQKNMVMIGAGQINNTINENAMAPGTIKGQQQQQQQQPPPKQGQVLSSELVTDFTMHKDWQKSFH